MADQAVAKKSEEAVDRLTVRPVSNISEEADAVLLRLEMPGVAKGDVDIRIEGDALHVYGKRNSYAENVSYVIHERHDADFRAVYTLDERVDRDKVDAHMENGVLNLKLHLKDEVKPRKIEIKAE